MDPTILHTISAHIRALERPQRIAISTRFPLLRRPAIAVRRVLRSMHNACHPKLARRRSSALLPCIIARHQSLLIRTLGTADMRLQHNKIENLRLAIERLNGLLIPPGKTFSFWALVGKPNASKGYLPGMLLSNGSIIEGIGGGLCQLSNFLFWILLHAPTAIVERHHHSYDVFPDSGRVLPFGSGATIFHNYVDLKMQSVSDQPLQLELWLTPTHLKGRVRSTHPSTKKFHIIERHHCFVEHRGRHFRFNQIWREVTEGGRTREELIATNFAPVMYRVDETMLHAQGTSVVHIPLYLKKIEEMRLK